MTRFLLVPERSAVHIEATSSLHPIHSRTEGLEGFIELHVHDGVVDVRPDSEGELSLRVDRMSSGNRLQDGEMQRRIDARRYPTIRGRMTDIRTTGVVGEYRVTGDLTFRGVTCRCEDDIVITVVDDRTVAIAGESTFDIREFGMEPPRILMLRVHPDVKVRIELTACCGGSPGGT
jgi:polyisoprenoid-binding protein YceI